MCQTTIAETINTHTRANTHGSRERERKNITHTKIESIIKSSTPRDHYILLHTELYYIVLITACHRCEVEAILYLFIYLFHLTPAFHLALFYLYCDIIIIYIVHIRKYIFMNAIVYISYLPWCKMYKLWVCNFIFNSLSCVIQFFWRIKKYYIFQFWLKNGKQENDWLVPSFLNHHVQCLNQKCETMENISVNKCSSVWLCYFNKFYAWCFTLAAFCGLLKKHTHAHTFI